MEVVPDDTEFDMKFLHRNKFEDKYGLKLPCPIILPANGSGSLRVAIARENLGSFKALDELVRRCGLGNGWLITPGITGISFCCLKRSP